MTAYLTYTNDLLVIKVQDHDKIDNSNFKVIKDVKQFMNFSRNIIYLKTTGEVHMLFYSDVDVNIADILLDWSEVLKVAKIAASYSFIVFEI